MNALPLRPLVTAWLIVVGLVCAGCDSSEDDPAIGGTYRASSTVSDPDFGTSTVAFRLVIPSTTGGPFTFTGEVTVDGDYADDFSGTGTYAYPSVTLAESGDDEDAITGAVSADGARLTFTDPASGQPLVFTRS